MLMKIVTLAFTDTIGGIKLVSRSVNGSRCVITVQIMFAHYALL
jgi:hypothetical protein